MKQATRTIRIFGVYLISLSLGFIFFPEKIIGMLGLTAAPIYWIRVLGIPLLVIGFHYEHAAAMKDIFFYRASVWARLTVFICFLSLALFSLAPLQVILFGLFDLFAATWTYAILKQNGLSESSKK